MDAVVELRAERMAAGGDALAHEQSGRVVFLRGALPGELVRARITAEKRDYASAEVTEVLEAGDDRIEPPCRNVARGCGGCSWQHASAAGQLRMKRDIVADAMRRTAHLPDAEISIGPALPSERFRTSVRLAVDDSGRLGYRGRRTNDLTIIDECLIAHPLLAELIGTIRLPGADEASLRCAARTGQRSLAWTARAKRVVRPIRVPVDVALGWTSTVTEIIAGCELIVSAGSFMQASPEAAEALVELVRAAAGSLLEATRLPVIDAYGGVGLFAATVCREVDRVVVIESSSAACADARRNVHGRAATVVESPVESWTAEPADLVIADPARGGLGRDGVAALLATGCQRLVLVSCDPVSLARDSGLLHAAGFDHAGSTVLDPFPHTPHVEVVTRFDRADR